MKGRHVAICPPIYSLPFLTCVLQSYFICIYQTHVSPNGLDLASENQQDMASRKGEKMDNSLLPFLIMLQQCVPAPLGQSQRLCASGNTYAPPGLEKVPASCQG